MFVLTCICQKGGTGKTTTAVSIAHKLSQLGYKTLLIDVDPQGNVADSLGLDAQPGLRDFIQYDTGTDAIIKSTRPNLACILGDHSTAETALWLTGQNWREKHLARAIKAANLAQYVDIIVIDTGPTLGLLQVNALVASTHYLIPVQLDHLSLKSSSETMSTAAALIKEGALNARLLGLLPTFYEQKTTSRGKMLALLTGHFKGLVWPAIPVCPRARESPGHGLTIWEYAKSSKSARGIRMNGKDGPFTGGYQSTIDRLRKELPL